MPETQEEDFQIFHCGELHHFSRNNASAYLPPFSRPNFPVSVIANYAPGSSAEAKEENFFGDRPQKASSWWFTLHVCQHHRWESEHMH